MKGVVNINKASGMTSSDVVVIVRGILRRITGEKHKVGHMGTLDPMGTGVLPIGFGTGTRLFDYLLNKDKVYETTFKFGFTTDTLDTTGNIIEKTDVIPTKEEILEVIPRLCGDVNQIPPQFSSKSIDGKRAYELARKGKYADIKPSRVSINNIQLIDQISDNEFKFKMEVSSGTYIRSIARDMAKELGSLAAMSSINRTLSGMFKIENSVEIREFEKEPLKHLITLDECLKDYPRFDIPENDIIHVLNGINKSYSNLPNGNFTVYANNELVGIGKNINQLLVIGTRL